MNQGTINLGNPVSSSPLNRGLVGWWLALPQRMGGATFWDLCKPGNHGTLTNGPTWQSAAGASGQFGSVKFDGVDDYSAAPASPLSGVTAATWVITVNISSSNGSNVGPVWHGNTAYSGSFYIGRDSGASGSASAGQTYVSTKILRYPVTFNAWNHVVLTFAASTRMSIYLNGLLATTDTSSIPASVPTHTGHRLGGDTTDSLYLGSRVASAAMFNRVLSDNEVYQLYNDSRTGYQQTLNRLPRRSYAVASAASNRSAAVWYETYRAGVRV